MEDENGTKKAIVAMACITILEAIALIQGINGAMLSVVVGALACGGGFVLGKRI